MILPPVPALWRGAVAGVFGAASGFCVFVLWQEESKAHQDPIIFFAALLIAACMSFAFDSFRDKVEGRHEAASGLPQTIVTISLLAIFELFILGLHATVSLMDSRKFQEIGNLVVRAGIVEKPRPWAHVGIMIVLWMVVAAVLTVGLCRAVFDRRCELPATYSWRDVGLWARPTGRGLRIGALVGAVGGPLAVLGYTFLIRVGAELRVIVCDVNRFIAHLDGVDERIRAYFPAVVAWPVTGLAWLYRSLTGVMGSPWGPMVALGLSVGLVALFVWIAVSADDGRFALPGLVIGLAYAVPLFSDIGYVGRLTLAVAIVWGFPGAVLGAMIPWLSAPSRYPRIWGFVAFVASVVLFVFALVGPSKTPLVPVSLGVAGLVILVVGLLFFALGGTIERYWPVLALCIAIDVLGLTRLVQGADFLNIQKDALLLSASDPATLRPRQTRLTDWITPADIARWRLDLPGLGESIAPWARPLSPAELKNPLWGAMSKPPDVFQTERLMATRATQMSALQTLVTDAVDRLRRSVDVTEREVDKSQRLSLRDEATRLDALKGATEGQLRIAEALQVRIDMELVGELVRPLPEEAPSWPGSPPDPTDAWTSGFRRQQREFTAAREAFATKLREHGAALGGVHTTLKDDLRRVVDGKNHIEEQVAAARMLELAMTASLGFWATIGVLAAWAVRHGTPEEGARAAPSP